MEIAHAVLAEGTVLIFDIPRGFAVPTHDVGKCVATAACQDLAGINYSTFTVPGVKQRLGIGTPLAEATPGEIMDPLAGRTIEYRSKVAWPFPEWERRGRGGMEPVARDGSKVGPAD